VLAQLQKDYPNDVRFAYRHLPLIGTKDRPFHDKAALAAQATEAAGLQGKEHFWDMHDLLFARQAEWTGMSVDQFKDWLLTQAGTLGLDTADFAVDLESQPLVDQVQAAWDRGFSIGMVSTPFLVINGSIWPTNIPMTYGNLEMVIKLDALEKRQFTTCPPMSIDPLKQYTATLKTVKGDIVIQLFADKAPLAVNSFIFLARQGWYDGVTFHIVVPGLMAQTGDPSGTGYGGPGYAFSTESSPDLKFDQAGVVGMANAGADSNMSQFFITLAPLPQYNGKLTVFGKVISGMDVVQRLAPRDPSRSPNLPPGDAILSVSIEEK
jgi:cyclophilin family peptidyl-prolyl cis-trans isomerase